jgi:hypothetical protein
MPDPEGGITGPTGCRLRNGLPPLLVIGLVDAG